MHCRSLSHDDLEIANPLGVHTKKYKVDMFYYTLGNIPPQHRLLAIAKTVDLKKFGARPHLYQHFELKHLFDSTHFESRLMTEHTERC